MSNIVNLRKERFGGYKPTAQLLRSVKKMSNLIYAPVSGVIESFENLPDPMLAVKAFGEGVVIQIKGDDLLSPCEGMVKYLHSNGHVAIIEAKRGVQVLVHVGAPSSMVRGCTPVVTEGEQVVAGQEIIQFELSELQKQNNNNHALVVVNELGENNTLVFSTLKGSVKAGEHVLYTVGDERLLKSADFTAYIEAINQAATTWQNLT